MFFYAMYFKDFYFHVEDPNNNLCPCREMKSSQELNCLAISNVLYTFLSLIKWKSKFFLKEQWFRVRTLIGSNACRISEMRGECEVDEEIETGFSVCLEASFSVGSTRGFFDCDKISSSSLSQFLQVLFFFVWSQLILMLRSTRSQCINRLTFLFHCWCIEFDY
jgi:hypothetical protein